MSQGCAAGSKLEMVLTPKSNVAQLLRKCPQTSVVLQRSINPVRFTTCLNELENSCDSDTAQRSTKPPSVCAGSALAGLLPTDQVKSAMRLLREGESSGIDRPCREGILTALPCFFVDPRDVGLALRVQSFEEGCDLSRGHYFWDLNRCRNRWNCVRRSLLTVLSILAFTLPAGCLAPATLRCQMFPCYTRLRPSSSSFSCRISGGIEEGRIISPLFYPINADCQRFSVTYRVTPL